MNRGTKITQNQILLAYYGIHFESLETMSIEDDKKAIELVKLKKANRYTLDKTHIEVMTRVSQTKKTPALITKRPEHKAKVKNREYANLKHRFKCKACGSSYDNKMDLTQHNALHHAQRNYIICNAQKYGDNHLNDHTKMYREKGTKKSRKR